MYLRILIFKLIKKQISWFSKNLKFTFLGFVNFNLLCYQIFKKQHEHFLVNLQLDHMNNLLTILVVISQIFLFCANTLMLSENTE